jgi:hypothetical protein
VEVDQHPKTLHDVGALADALEDPDSLNQQTVYDHVCNVPDHMDGSDAYEALNERTVTVNDLRNLYRQQNEIKAIALLHNRQKLQVERQYITRLDDPRFAVSSDTTFLDFIMVVGNTMGIDVFLPNVGVNGEFFLTVRLDLHIKEFRVKHGDMGFDPTGAMLCIGSTECMDLWIAMAPVSFLQDTSSRFDLDCKHGDTRLITSRSRIVKAFLIKQLSRIRNRDIYIHDVYAMDIHGPKHKMVTNAL